MPLIMSLQVDRPNAAPIRTPPGACAKMHKGGTIEKINNFIDVI